jgi:hypothetical protein
MARVLVGVQRNSTRSLSASFLAVPYLSLLPPVFSRLDSFCVLFLDALGFHFTKD